MPWIEVDTSLRLPFDEICVGVVVEANFVEAHQLRTGNILFKEKPGRLIHQLNPPEWLSIFLLLGPVATFFLIAGAYFKPISQFAQHHSDLVTKLLVAPYIVWIALCFVYFAGHAIRIVRREPYEEILDVAHNMQLRVEDFSMPAHFAPRSISINSQYAKNQWTDLKVGDVVVVYTLKEALVSIAYMDYIARHNWQSWFTSQYVNVRRSPAADYIAHTVHLAYCAQGSPLIKHPFDFSGEECQVSYSQTGATLSEAFFPWTSYLVGLVSVKEVRFVQETGIVDRHHADVSLYKWGEILINPLITHRLIADQLGSLQTGHVAAFLMIDNAIGAIYDMTTSVTYRISYNIDSLNRPSENVINDADLFLLDDEQRYEAEARIFIQNAAKSHVEELLNGAPPSPPHV